MNKCLRFMNKEIRKALGVKKKDTYGESPAKRFMLMMKMYNDYVERINKFWYDFYKRETDD